MGYAHNKIDFKIMRSVCLWLSDFECFICHKKELKMHVHHVDKNAYNNNLVNLMVLCPDCHQMAHRVNMMSKVSYKSIIILLLKKVVQFNNLKNPIK